MDDWCIQRTMGKDLTYIIDIYKDTARIYAQRPKRTTIGCCVLRGRWARSFADMVTQNEFLTYCKVAEGSRDTEMNI